VISPSLSLFLSIHTRLVRKRPARKYKMRGKVESTCSGGEGGGHAVGQWAIQHIELAVEWRADHPPGGRGDGGNGHDATHCVLFKEKQVKTHTHTHTHTHTRTTITNAGVDRVCVRHLVGGCRGLPRLGEGRG